MAQFGVQRSVHKPFFEMGVTNPEIVRFYQNDKFLCEILLIRLEKGRTGAHAFKRNWGGCGGLPSRSGPYFASAAETFQAELDRFIEYFTGSHSGCPDKPALAAFLKKFHAACCAG